MTLNKAWYICLNFIDLSTKKGKPKKVHFCLLKTEFMAQIVCKKLGQPTQYTANMYSF
jgi:hypothetical protein